MRLIVDKILWGALILFFGPTVMIVASWNTLPGDSLYGVKLAMERAVVTIASPSYASSGTLQIKYTERRYAETKQLLASRQSIEGLPYLQQQIAETKKMIDNAPNKEAQVALAKQYINTLSTVSTDLEVQKQTYVSPQPLAKSLTPPSANPPPTQYNPTSTPLPSPSLTATPTPQPTTPTIGKTMTTIKPTASMTSTPKPTSTPVPTPTIPQIALANTDQKSQISVTVPLETKRAVAALQISQMQQDVSRTIVDLQAIVDRDDKDQNENHKRQKEEKENKEDKERKEDKKTINLTAGGPA